ncbi:MAG: hypothetical protein KKH77_07080 [Candidatus Omnitrophica bacterium]|nr:hypothetical protein [Candidatus Omnitrophota bacterium]MBU1808142.1 hypothetical protein [Candidatus Omnitrophota bacterium]
MAESFELGKVFSVKGWYQFIGIIARIALIALFVLAFLFVYSLFAPKKPSVQQNQPQITGDHAAVTNNYIQNKEAGAWEAGGHAGVIRLGDQNGGYAGLELKRRF